MDRDWQSLVSLSLLSLALSTLNLTAKAQITPDSTLGGESSVVTPVNPQFERIDGSQFSATNPQGVPLLTINVPVTVGLQFEGDSSGTIINAADLAAGKNLALIGGTIVSTGQLSALNGEISLSTIAEGVVKLDEAGKVLGKEIQSSLISSQGGEKSGLFLSGLVAENGQITGLTVNSDGQVMLGDSQTAVKVGDIVVAGSSERVSLQAQTAKLSAGKDLTLLGSQVGTVGEMTLLAQDTVRMRDSAANPLVVAAGGQLEVQGNQQVDIFALNHPDSELVSGGDMVLKSASEVIGDAHFWSGGSFRIEKLDGSLGDLVSPNDPIIRCY